MPKYRITSPDGATYEVTAPEGASRAQVLGYAQAQHVQAKQAPSGVMDTITHAIGNVADNLTPNWGDEVAGAGAWLGAKLGTNGRDPKTAFADAQREFKAGQERYKANHPVLSKITAATGLLGGLAAPVGRLAEGASMASRMAHGAAVGAGYGAVSGAGEGDGLEKRAANAARGAWVGGVGGAVLPPGIAAASRAGRVIRNTVPGADAAARAVLNVPRAVMRRPLATRATDAADRAAQLVTKRANQGNIAAGFGEMGAPATPDAITGEVQRRAAMGVPAMAADTTDAMRGLTGWASRGVGPGQTRVRQALDARKAQEADRVRQHVIDTMGDVVDPRLALEQHMAQASQSAQPAYRAAYAQPVVVTPEMAGIMRTPAFQDAVPHAVRNIRNAQRDPEALGFRMDDQGNVTGTHTLTTEGFDQVIRAMRDSGRAAMDTSGVRPKDTTDSVHINARARDLRDQLMAQNEPYREAVTRYADDMAQRDAFQAGQDVLKRTGHEINEQARHMPDASNEAWSVGARSALADEASRFGAQHPTGNTAARVRQGLGDSTKQDAIGQLTGNTRAVRALQDRLEAEHQGNLMWNEVQGNSRTAQRQQNDADVDGSLGSFNLSDLQPRRILERAANTMSAGLTEGMRNDVKDHVARIVTEQDPDTLRQLFGSFAEAEQRRQARAALTHRLGISATKVAGMNALAPDPDGE